MVYGIVGQIGGTITVESERHRGAMFSDSFSRRRGVVGGDHAAARPAVPYAGSETILLVEDEPGVRHLVQRVLSAKGYRVLEARDVTHAAELRRAHAGAIHLLLSDVVMPGMSGPELANQIVAQAPRDSRALHVRVRQSAERRARLGRHRREHPAQAVHAREPRPDGARASRRPRGSHA